MLLLLPLFVVQLLVQLVLFSDVLAVGSVHAGNEPAQRGNTVTLANAQHRRVDMSRASFQGGIRVGNCAPGVVVEVALDVARDNGPQCLDELIDLPGIGAPNSVGNSDAVDANLRG